MSPVVQDVRRRRTRSPGVTQKLPRRNAEALHESLKSLVRASGGWTRLHDSLPPGERAKLAIRLAEVAEREQARAEEMERRRTESEEFLRSPAIQGELETMAMDWIRKHPGQAARMLLASGGNNQVIRAIADDERWHKLLARAGWTKVGADGAYSTIRLRAWTEDEIKLLGTMPDGELGARLNRPRLVVLQKRHALGIAPFGRRFRHHWTEDQIKLLGTMPDAEVAKRVGLKCADTVRKKRKELGIPPHNGQRPPLPPHKWTDDEIAMLGELPDSRLAWHLCVRVRAVTCKRQKLGIPSWKSRQPRHEWTEAEIKLLGTMSDSRVGERIGVSQRNVCTMRMKLGIPPWKRPRPRRIPKPTAVANLKRWRSRPFRWTEAELSVLGTMPDSHAAIVLGMAETTIHKKRNELGIPPYGEVTPDPGGPKDP